MSKYKVKPLSPAGLKTYSLKSRKDKVNINNFAQILSAEKSFTRFVRSLPDILAGSDFKEFISLMGKAKKRNRAIIFGLGAHVIKVGLSPIIIDLLKQGWISALALNGAGIIHDFEIALTGQTSEDVQAQIKNGHFGMAQETGQMLNAAINSGEDKGLGLGEAVGEMIRF